MMQQRFGTLVCKLIRYPMKGADSLLEELPLPRWRAFRLPRLTLYPPDLPSRSPPSHVHSIPHEGFPENSDFQPSEDPPSSFQAK